MKDLDKPTLRLLERFTLPMWRSGLDAKCDYFNKAWLEFRGRTLEQELGEGWMEGIHPDDRAEVRKGYLEAFQARRSFLLEYRLRRQDGAYRWVMDRGAPLDDTKGRFAGYLGGCHDITERRLTEEALRKSETLFAGFMSHLQEYAWMKDLEGRYIFANDMLLQTEPYRTDWLGKTDAELWPAEMAAAFRAKDEMVIATGKPLRAVESYLVNGEVSHVLVSKFPILGATGAVEMVGGTSIDITESKKAEDALAEQVIRYRTLLETSADSIYVLNENGDLQEANGTFLRRRGYTASEAKSLNVADWDAQWTREQLQGRLRKLVDSNAVFETRHRCKDGSVFDVEVSSTGVRIAGQPLFFCVARDITERKQSEQARRESEIRFRQIAENISEVFWVWAATPKKEQLLYVSPAYATIWGRSCESLYSSPQSWREALHPNDKEWVLAEIANLDLEKMSDLIYRIVCPDQSIRWIRDRIFPVRDTGGVVTRFAGIAGDITESKEAEEAVRTANRKLQILSRRRIQVQEDERRRLSRELHDQIGQVITAGSINLQSARKLKDRRAINRKLDETIASFKQILQQVRQISFDIRPPVLDDLGLAPALRWMLDDSAARAGLAAEFFAERNLKRGDAESETACFRVGLEAVSNVVRHAKAKKVWLELRNAENALQLLVRDDGIGFDVADAEKRVHRDRLGLVGMSERATSVGGQFECKSVPGHGTEVSALFPISAGSD